MLCELLLIGWLAVAIPAGFTISPVAVDDIAPVAGPPGQPPVRVWSATMTDGSREVDVTVFSALPPYPGGPMVVVRTETVVVNGGELRVVWTSMFMGTSQEVAVAYPREPTGAGSAMIVLRNLPFDEALALIPTVLGGCE